MTESQTPRKTPVRQQLRERGLRRRPVSPSLKPPLVFHSCSGSEDFKGLSLTRTALLPHRSFVVVGCEGLFLNQVLIPLPMTECAQTTQPVFLICPLFSFPLSPPTFFPCFFFFCSLSPPWFPPPHPPPILSFYCNHGAGG